MRPFLSFVSTLLIFFFPFGVKCQVNLQNGLVAYYPFNGSVSDVSGNNHNGTIVNGIEYGLDRFGNPNSATKYNGNDNYIRVPDDGAFSTPQISISLWFKTDSDDLQNLIGKRRFENDGTPGGGAQYQFFINYNLYPGIGSNLVGNNASCFNANTSSYLNTVDPICKERWYHAVITFDGSRHKVYINGVLKRNELTAYNSFLICNSEIRFGVWWSGGTLPYKGLMDDARWYNRALNQNEVLALYGNFSQPTSYDFSFNQDLCSPKSVQFSSSNITGNSYKWFFGNGTSAINVNDPIVNYNTFGVYPVKLEVTRDNGCVDSVTKLIPILAQQDKALISNNDTAICKGKSVQIDAADGGLGFCWFPSNQFSNPKLLHQVVSPAISTTYYFTSQVQQTNLVINGDFSQGNVGFSSDYKSAAANTTEAQYYVANDSRAWNRNFNSCVEHTTGSGRMMMVNGSAISGAKVWSQNIAVTPNTNYAFSTWIQSLAGLNPASLKFSINAITLGDNINAGSTACEWKQFYTTWNSGNASTATISIVNNNTIADGNDFAIDDINFSTLIIKQDSIQITVSPPPTIRSITDTSICSGKSITLQTTGGTVYKWDPDASISNPDIANPVVTPLNSSRYIVNAYNAPGCSGSDTINVTVLQSPALKLTEDTTICAGTPLQLLANGGAAYQWTPSAGLSSSSIANPVTTTTINRTYTVTATSAAGCSSIDSVKVQAVAAPLISSIKDTAVCNGSPVVLATNVAGATSFNWSPSAGLSNAYATNPTALPAATVDYVITAVNSSCAVKDTVRLTVKLKPVISITNDTTICQGNALQLNASGGIGYKWSPALGLSNSNIPNPLSNTANSVVYYATVDSANGCSAIDSVKVQVRSRPAVSTIKDTSVCSGTQLQLTSTVTSGAEVSWSPSTGLSGTTIDNPLATPNSTTKYYITAGTGGCTAVDSVLLDILTIPTVSLTNDTLLCSGTKVQLNASGGATYKWSPAIGLTADNTSNPVASPIATTLYFVDVKGANGCSKKDSLTLTVAPTPTVSTIEDTTTCSGVPVTLVTSSVAGVQYSWSPSIGLNNPSIANPVALPAIATKYIVTVSTDNNCSARDSVQFDVLSVPVISKSNDTTVCSGAGVQLFASGGTGYQWSPAMGLSNAGIANPISMPDTTTMYHLLVKGSNGCTKSDSVEVGVRPLPSFSIFPAAASICEKEVITLKASGGDAYEWLPANPVVSPNLASTVVSPSATSTYSVRIHETTCNFTDTLSTVVTVNALPVILLTKSNDIDCSFPTAVLKANGGNKYAWSPAANVSDITSASPKVSPAATTFYAVKVTNAQNCTSVDSIQVKVNLAGNASTYDMPTAFTPNGDGKNDCFGLKYWGNVSNIDFAIFNRWGERVFHATDPSACWDGTYKNVRQNSAAFVYVIKAKTVCAGEISRKGTLVLIR